MYFRSDRAYHPWIVDEVTSLKGCLTEEHSEMNVAKEAHGYKNEDQLRIDSLTTGVDGDEDEFRLIAECKSTFEKIF